MPIPAEAVNIHLASGRAALRVAHRRIRDFGNLYHALRGDPSEPAEVSFDVRWGDVIRRLDLRDEDVGFEGHFVENHAAIAWSARQEGFEFVSDPMATSQTVFAVIGRERNGVFSPANALRVWCPGPQSVASSLRTVASEAGAA